MSKQTKNWRNNVELLQVTQVWFQELADRAECLRHKKSLSSSSIQVLVRATFDVHLCLSPGPTCNSHNPDIKGWPHLWGDAGPCSSRVHPWGKPLD